MRFKMHSCKLQEVLKQTAEDSQEAARKELAELMIKAKEQSDQEEAAAAAAAISPEQVSTQPQELPPHRLASWLKWFHTLFLLDQSRICTCGYGAAKTRQEGSTVCL